MSRGKDNLCQDLGAAGTASEGCEPTPNLFLSLPL